MTVTIRGESVWTILRKKSIVWDKDKYFIIQHRNETRGLGSIFFDDQNDRDPNTGITISTPRRVLPKLTSLMLVNSQENGCSLITCKQENVIYFLVF